MTLRATRPTVADLPEGYQFGDAGPWPGAGWRPLRYGPKWLQDAMKRDHGVELIPPRLDSPDWFGDPPGGWPDSLPPPTGKSITVKGLVVSGCICPDYLTGGREVPIGSVVRCPVHQDRTFHRGPSSEC